MSSSSNLLTVANNISYLNTTPLILLVELLDPSFPHEIRDGTGTRVARDSDRDEDTFEKRPELLVFPVVEVLQVSRVPQVKVLHHEIDERAGSVAMQRNISIFENHDQCT